MSLIQSSQNWSQDSITTNVWFGRNADDLPVHKILPFSKKIFASYTGPESGLTIVEKLMQENASISDSNNNGEESDITPSSIVGCEDWNIKNRKAYGISMSLYDQHPISSKITGDPVADCFGICGIENGSVMVVADGVNWGEASRLAARCAVYGAMKSILGDIFSKESEGQCLSSSKEVFGVLLASLQQAHKTIIQLGGGLTTLCVCVVCPIAPTNQETPSQDIPSIFSKDKNVLNSKSKTLPLDSALNSENTLSGMADLCGNLSLSSSKIDFINKQSSAQTSNFLTTDQENPDIISHFNSDKKFDTSDNNDKETKNSEKDTTPDITSSKIIPSLKSSSPQSYIACVVNVGDSLAFVFSRRHGVREITTGSHDVTLERDLRDAGGALGPVREGDQPELNNLTCSQTLMQPGDVVFLATDGITDNFDPVVTKIAVPKKYKLKKNGFKDKKKEEQFLKNQDDKNISKEKNLENGDLIKENETVIKEEIKEESQNGIEDIDTDQMKIENNSTDLNGEEIKTTNIDSFYGNIHNGLSGHDDGEDESEEELGLVDGKPEMLPFERHRYAIKQMERVLHEFELMTESSCSAQELCGAILHHVLVLTDSKRKVLENPELYRRGKRKKMTEEQRTERDKKISSQLASSPGKLDHATIIGFEVGIYHDNEDEDYME